MLKCSEIDMMIKYYRDLNISQIIPAERCAEYVMSNCVEVCATNTSDHPRSRTQLVGNGTKKNKHSMQLY